MFKAEYNQEAIHAANTHAFGTPSDAWLKWLESLASVKNVETLEDV